MPLLKIPTAKQAESKIRLCRSMLHLYEVERFELQEQHRAGELSPEELALCLRDLQADIQRLQDELASARLICRQSTAA